MTKHVVAKRILRGKVSTEDRRTFIVGKAAASEETVFLSFDHPVKYRVVKLSIRGLPRTTSEGRKITWINNFAVKGPSGRYAGRVRYSVFLRGRPGKTFVYYDQRGLRMDKKPKPVRARHMPRGWVKVVFTTGDPAHGWT